MCFSGPEKLNTRHSRFAAGARRWRLCCGLILLLLLPSSAYCASDMRILVVLSDNLTPYENFANTFRQNLPASFQVTILENPERFSENDQGKDLIVSVGAKATDWITGKTRTPILAVMVPGAEYTGQPEKPSQTRQITAIYIDQPWSRQLALLNAALPGRRNVGVLYSPDTKLNLQALRNELNGHGYKLTTRKVLSNESLATDLKEVLQHSDVLLAVPDSNVFNSSNIRYILLSSYRQHVPLVGLSQAYVNAGALCAIFSTPEQFAAQASVMANQFAQTRRLAEPQTPLLYTIAVNQDVARALNVTTQSADLLRMKIDNAQGVPQ
jgi:putative ABC transport system substrate-binding protein